MSTYSYGSILLPLRNKFISVFIFFFFNLSSPIKSHYSSFHQCIICINTLLCTVTGGGSHQGTSRTLSIVMHWEDSLADVIGTQVLSGSEVNRGWLFCFVRLKHCESALCHWDECDEFTPLMSLSVLRTWPTALHNAVIGLVSKGLCLYCTLEIYCTSSLTFNAGSRLK